MPAMLSAGLDYRLSDALNVSLGTNYFFDKTANYGHKLDIDLNSATPSTFVKNKCNQPGSNELELLAKRNRWIAFDQLICTVWPADGQVAVISVAAAGWTNPYSGIVLNAPNIEGWTDIRLKESLEGCFNAPVIVGNDANLAAFGESMYGSGKGPHHLIYLTVSTGIGGGVIVDDKLLLGERGLAAE